MAATVRMILTLLFVAKARCGLLPVDLSGISPGALLHLGLDTPNGGLLGSLGDIVSSGVGTVGSLGQGVLGKVTALTLQHQSDPSDIVNVEPWKQDLSYAAYLLDNHKGGQSKQVSYAEWINKRHRDYYERLSHHGGDSSTSPEHPVPQPPLDNQVPQFDKPADDILDGTHVYLDKKSALGDDESKIIPFSTERPDKSNEVDDTIHFPESEEIIKINPDENIKPEPARDVIIVQNPNVGVTTAPVNHNNQIIILQPGNQQSANGIYVLPTASNPDNQDVNVVPKVPTVYVDDQGRRYYIIQMNENQVNQPVQPIKVTTPPNNQGYKQIYVIMNVNGQQVLVPASSLPVNGLQMDINVKPNPTSPGQLYLYVPSNNDLNNMATSPPLVTNPIINYVTTPKYISFEKAPVTENNGSEISEANNSEQLPSDVGNTKEESEREDTDETGKPLLGDDDIRK